MTNGAKRKMRQVKGGTGWLLPSCVLHWWWHPWRAETRRRRMAERPRQRGRRSRATGCRRLPTGSRCQ